ncbi:MAG: hypothetical protein JWM77_758 [Rhodospirillales bacterium]|nr:hypothetical protein [Rhodospirillales bacterium]
MELRRKPRLATATRSAEDRPSGGRGSPTPGWRRRRKLPVVRPGRSRAERRRSRRDRGLRDRFSSEPPAAQSLPADVWSGWRRHDARSSPRRCRFRVRRARIRTRSHRKRAAKRVASRCTTLQIGEGPGDRAAWCWATGSSCRRCAMLFANQPHHTQADRPSSSRMVAPCIALTSPLTRNSTAAAISSGGE